MRLPTLQAGEGLWGLELMLAAVVRGAVPPALVPEEQRRVEWRWEEPARWRPVEQREASGWTPAPWRMRLQAMREAQVAREELWRRMRPATRGAQVALAELSPRMRLAMRLGLKPATPAERQMRPWLTWPCLKMSGSTFHSLLTRICRLTLAWSHLTPPRLERRMLPAQMPATVPQPARPAEPAMWAQIVRPRP